MSNAVGRRFGVPQGYRGPGVPVVPLGLFLSRIRELAYICIYPSQNGFGWLCSVIEFLRFRPLGVPVGTPGTPSD